MKGGLHPLSRWEAPEVQHWQQRRRDKRDRKEQNSKASARELLLHSKQSTLSSQKTPQTKPLLCVEGVVPQPGQNTSRVGRGEDHCGDKEM